MVRPLSDRVFVRPFEPEGKIGNILLSDGAKSSPLKGEVIAVGPGKIADNGKLVPMQVKRGDVVLYSFGGQDTKVGDEQYLVFRESNLLAVVTPE